MEIEGVSILVVELFFVVEFSLLVVSPKPGGSIVTWVSSGHIMLSLIVLSVTAGSIKSGLKKETSYHHTAILQVSSYCDRIVRLVL